jgi:hypothetical protein
VPATATAMRTVGFGVSTDDEMFVLVGPYVLNR